MQSHTTSLKLDSKKKLTDLHKPFFEKASKILLTDLSKNAISTFVFEDEVFRLISIKFLMNNGKSYEQNCSVSNTYRVFNSFDLFKNYIQDDESICLFFDSKVDDANLFDSKNENSFVNYPLTVTELEKLNLLETKKSVNWLATDERVFRIKHDLESDWSEVDILGTPFGEQMSEKILELWKNAQHKI